MIKLVLWDYTGQSSSWCEKFLRPNVYEVVRTLKPDDPDQAEVVMRGDWDYVLVFADDDTKKVFDEMLATMQELNVSTDRIIFVDKLVDWSDNPAAAHLLLNPTEAERIFRWLTFANHKQWNRYAACEVDGLHYVATTADRYIVGYSYVTGKNHAADEMQAFHALTKKYYRVDDSEGYFLDLGANIGTTGIYFLTKLAPNLKLFAVEPDAENFKLLRVNLIMNELDTRTTLVNCGLGEDFDTLTMYRDLKNPGGNSVFHYLDGAPTETIQIAPLDYLLAESDISPEEVKYIWIDTEGFEPQVLFGARNLLARSNVPVFMECNLLAWQNSGSFDRLIDLLAATGYRHFISVDEHLQKSNENIYPLDALKHFVKDAPPPLGQIGDIFLIKNLQA